MEPRLDLAPASGTLGFVRRKGHIGTGALIGLALLGSLPFLLVLCRLLALPGGESFQFPGLGFFRGVGEVLEQWFTLAWVPPGDRPSILYLLLLPTGALLIATTRLVLGVRVLGFRAILIAIGFKASGFVPSLVLMAVIVGTILVIRPWFRRIRLPLYARVAVILCLCAVIMIGAVLVAPWLRSETVWGVAFFPVIIMAMLAEGIARTLEQDNAVTAVWRAGWTLGLALVIALIDRAIAPVVYQFPELIVTELLAIVFVSEFFDLRLLEDVPSRLARRIEGAGPGESNPPRIAVVRNQESSGVIGRFGARSPSRYRGRSVQRPVDALREQGFQVKVLEGDMTLLRELQGYLPWNQRRNAPGGLVFNLASGVQGEGRFSHVPAMLEMAGIPYTGPGPIAHARLADRVALLTLLDDALVTVPRHRSASDPMEFVDLDFPLSVCPRYEPDAPAIVVRNRERLQKAIRAIRRGHGQPAVVEEIVRGRRILASVVGNEILEVLPLVEIEGDEGRKSCPAELDEGQAERIRECARTAFRAAGCRDYARIDLRVTPFGEPYVLDIRWVDLFDRRGAFVLAAESAGYTFAALMRRIVDEAARRYAPTPRVERRETTPDSRVASIAGLGLVAILLASSALACAPQAGAVAVAPGFGTFPFVTRDGRTLEVKTYRPRDFDAARGPIWFVMHGASRDAERYVRAAAPVAERVGALVVVPHFTRALYPKGSDYTFGLGRSPETSVFAEIERLFDGVQRAIGASRPGYYLFGHSAGAQFTHRLLTFLPNARVLGAVAANAGWYTLPVEDGSPAHAIPYGLRGGPVRPGELRHLFATPLTILVGERDTTTAEEDELVRGTREAQAQGSTRLERGRNYFRVAEAAAAKASFPFAWKLATVPRAAHDAASMIDSAAFLLFATKEAPCTATPAAAAKGLAFGAFLADPAPGIAGDANGDGKRDPSEDEFVEIVNRGPAPVCLAGWALGDVDHPERHVFPLGRALAPGGKVVVFGGGVPTGRFGGAEVQWAEDGLSLQKEGDVVTLRDASNVVVTQLSWGDCASTPCAADHRPVAPR